MSTYKRLVNEYKRYNELDTKPNDFNYIIYTIDDVDYSKDFSFKTIVTFKYQGQSHEVQIFYSCSYPFSRPSKLLINSLHIDSFAAS